MHVVRPTLFLLGRHFRAQVGDHEIPAGQHAVGARGSVEFAIPRILDRHPCGLPPVSRLVAFTAVLFKRNAATLAGRSSVDSRPCRMLCLTYCRQERRDQLAQPAAGRRRHCHRENGNGSSAPGSTREPCPESRQAKTLVSEQRRCGINAAAVSEVLSRRKAQTGIALDQCSRNPGSSWYRAR